MSKWSQAQGHRVRLVRGDGLEVRTCERGLRHKVTGLGLVRGDGLEVRTCVRVRRHRVAGLGLVRGDG